MHLQDKRKEWGLKGKADAGVDPRDRLTYWRQTVGNLPEPLRLREGHPPARTLPFDRERLELIGEEGLANGLEEWAAAEGVSPYLCLLGGFGALLSRYSHREDVWIAASPDDDRSARGKFAPLLRLDLTDDPSFETLLRRIEAEAGRALENEVVPFEQVLSDLGPEYSTEPWANRRIAFGCEPHAESREESDGPYLQVNVTSRGNELVFNYTFSPVLYPLQWVGRFHRHFVRLLELAVEFPARPVSRLSLLSDTERSLVVEKFNETDKELPGELIPDALVDRAGASPGEVAIEHEESSLTFAALDEASLAIAGCLREQGCGKGDIVAVLLGRSPNLIASLLGIWRAGAAYLPIDPQHPTARIKSILDDAHPTIVITSSEHVTRCGSSTRVLVIEDALEHKGTDPNVLPAIAAEDLAYVIYTSGTTGTPKGVMVDHASVANFVWTAIDSFGLTDADRVLQFMAIDFDASIQDIFSTLVVGGTLVLRTDEMLSSTERFIAECGRQKISALILTTSFWKELAAGMDAGGSSCLHRYDKSCSVEEICLPRAWTSGEETSVPKWKRSTATARRRRHCWRRVRT